MTILPKHPAPGKRPGRLGLTTKVVLRDPTGRTTVLEWRVLRAALLVMTATAPPNSLRWTAAVHLLCDRDLALVTRLALALLRKNPAAIDALLFDRRLLLTRAEVIVGKWRLYDPRVRRAFREMAPEPPGLQRLRAAKRQAIRGALWLAEHGELPHMSPARALALSHLSRFDRLAKLTIAIAEEQLRAGLARTDRRARLLTVPEELRGRRPGRRKRSHAADLEGHAHLLDPEALLLVREDGARREQALAEARQLVARAGLSEPEGDAFIVVKLLGGSLADWARETGTAFSTARTFWARAKAKLREAGAVAV